MPAFATAVLSALWLGILTSISPCPLATNVATISYLGNKVEDTRSVLIKGLLYTLGRTATYVAVASVSVFAILSVPRISFFLQHHINKLIGPLLVIVGLAVLEILPVPSISLPVGRKENVASNAAGSAAGAGFLGMLFALSFCPTSAALFFGSLIPLAITAHSVIVLPAVYGLGTALPVAGFAILITISAKSVAGAFKCLSVVERWARWTTGAIFIVLGIYFCAVYLVR